MCEIKLKPCRFGGGGVKLALTCGNCKWYEPFCGVCCNGDSEHRADFRLEDETCEEWDENDVE